MDAVAMSDRVIMRDVVRAFEIEGPKGGHEMVHVLSCGCWVINRRKVPAQRLRCISCGIPAVHDARKSIARDAFYAGVRNGGDSCPSDRDYADVQASIAIAFEAYWERVK